MLASCVQRFRQYDTLLYRFASSALLCVLYPHVISMSSTVLSPMIGLNGRACAVFLGPEEGT